MLHIPNELWVKYGTILTRKTVPVSFHNHYKKWLRYYLDYCHKYKQPYANRQSLLKFTEKLREKNQSSEQQKEAVQAVSIYYEMLGAKKSEDSPNSIVKLPLTYPHPNPLPEGEGEKGVGRGEQEVAEWKKAHAELFAEIKTRHYSPKTLKSYAMWVRKFQFFIKNKKPDTLSPADVKEFLRFLAIKKNVSASSQNQAFNAILFFYRHVLKTNFGDQRDNVRAKRRRHIPVILSREDIDSVFKNFAYPYTLVVKLLYGRGLRVCLNA